jgi:hypothetical protein
VTDFEALIRALADHRVEFIVVGGFAAVIHGSARFTQDLDIVYARAPENVERLVTALMPHRPYLRGAPSGLPFRFDVATIQRGLNLTLATALGDVDILGEILGGGTYESLLPHTVTITVFGRSCRCLDLPGLIRAKRAAGRPKDFEAVAELEVLLDERERRG